MKNGLIKFQTPSNIENIKNTDLYTSKKSGTTSVFKWIVSVIDSGFLVQIQDITGRKKSEESLRRSEEKYHRLFDDDLTGDFIATPEGIILECNPSFVEIYGFNKSDQAVGSDFSNFNSSDWVDLIARLKSECEIKGYQSWQRRLDGKEIHVVANVVGIFSDSGELIQVKGYVFDDTDRKNAEESLRRSEEKYHRLFDDDLTGDFIATPEGIILECNPSFVEIYGFNKSDQAVGSDFSNFNSSDWVDLIARLKSEREIKGYQSWQRRLDGKEIHVVANVVGIFSDSGELIQVKGYVFDDTDRKNAEESLRRSEEKYHRLFDDDLTGDFIATPEGIILECNPSFVEIYGFNKSDQAVGSDFSNFNSSDWVDLIARLKSECEIKGYQSWQRRLDGKEIHVVANVVGIFSDSGELIQVKGYVFDDTDRKNAEESLRRSEEKYHRLFDDDLTGDFIATPEGIILECNPSFADIYGLDDCEKIDQLNISNFNSFDWPYLITRIKSERKIKGFHSWQRRSDGMRIHVVANVVGIFSDSGELIQVKGYVFDDTERKKAEEEVANSKHQITEILDSIQDGFVSLNHYWNLIYVNRRAAEYASVEPEDLKGQNLWERFPELIGTTYETAFRKAIDKQKIQHFEGPGLHTHDHWFDVSVYPSVDGISIYWRDITNTKKL